MKALAENLKKYRKEKGLSQEELAQKMNVTRQTISGWETGRCEPDLEMLKDLADALQTEVSELLGDRKEHTYPHYQRKYILWSAISGAVAVMYFVFYVFVLDALREYRNQHIGSFDLYLFLVDGFPQIAYFATGILLPAAYCLFHPLCISPKWRIACLCVGIAFVFPAFLIAAGIACNWYPGIVGVIVRYILYPTGRAILIWLLPFLSGILLFLGCNRKCTD